MNYTKPYILECLEFHHPHTAYQDSNGKDVCGCCGTYYVVGLNELKYIQTTTKEMYKALNYILEATMFTDNLDDTTWQAFRSKAVKAVNKAEGKEGS